MARIVCQALQRADRVTLIWSEGEASFEPYQLTGAEYDALSATVRQARERLARAQHDGEAVPGDLAALGHQLYRHVIRADAVDRGPAAEVETWLRGRIDAGRVESLEFLSDEPGRIPWNLLCEQPASAGRTTTWGERFALTAGRRVNPLRQAPFIEEPATLVALDPVLADALSPTERDLLRSWQDAGNCVVSTEGLAARLREQTPDVLLVVARASAGAFHFGPQRVTPAELANRIAEHQAGSADPIVVIVGVGASEDVADWPALLGAVAGSLNGAVVNEVPLPGRDAMALGLDLVRRFTEDRLPLGECLRALRAERPAAGLALTAYCPPFVRVLGPGDEGVEPPEANRIELLPLPEQPYRPFAAYDREDRPLFFGREDDTVRGALLLDAAATRGVLLHGSAAVGKTSYLQAGLLPYLEQEARGYRVLRDRSPEGEPDAETDYPVLVLRATGDLAGQLADALCVFCARPLTYATPIGGTVTVDLPGLLSEMVLSSPAGRYAALQDQNAPLTDTEAATAIAAEGTHLPAPAATEPGGAIGPREVWAALNEDPELLAQLLEALTRQLPDELVIAVDQGEELLTQPQRRGEKVRRHRALEMLQRLAESPARCKVILVVRGEFLGRLSALWPAGREQAGWRELLLDKLSEQALAGAAAWPTHNGPVPYSDEIPQQKYGFTFEEGVPARLAEAAADAALTRRLGAPTFLQAACHLLSRRVRARKSAMGPVRPTDLRAIGSVEDAPERCLDAALAALKLSRATATRMRGLLARLVEREPDGTVTRALLPAEKLKDEWPGKEPPEPIVNRVAEDAGLLEIQQLFIDGQAGFYISLPQDSLAYLSARQDEERRLNALARGRVVDTLWIMIPLVFLAAAVSYAATRYFARSREERRDEQWAKSLVEAAERSGAALPQQYLGVIARADGALRAGDVLQARQLLLTQPALRADMARPVRIEGGDGGFRITWQPDDLRSFEWGYLWGQVNAERRHFAGHLGAITAVAVASDGRRAASASRDGTVKLWALERGQILATLAAGKGEVRAVAFSPDGKTIATGGADRLVHLYDISGLKDDAVVLEKARELTGHDGPVLALAYAKDGTLASGGADKTVRLWDAKGKAKATLKNLDAPVYALAFAPDGKTLASGGGATVTLWDAAGTKKSDIKTGLDVVAALAFAPDGKTLAGGGARTLAGARIGKVHFWNTVSGKETRAPLEHAAGVFALAYHPNGKHLASAGRDTHVRLWDVAAGRALGSWSGHLGWVGAAAFTPDGAGLVTGSYDNLVRLWDADRFGGPQVLRGHADAVQALALAPGDTLLASGDRAGAVRLWDATTGKAAGTLPPQGGPVTALVFAPTTGAEPLLAVGTRGVKDAGGVRLWRLRPDPKTGWSAHELKAPPGAGAGVNALAFGSSGGAGAERGLLLAAAGPGAETRVWDLNLAAPETSKAPRILKGHEAEVRCLAFTAEGKVLFTGGRDGLVLGWYAPTGHLAMQPLPAHPGGVEAISYAEAIAADGSKLAPTFTTAGADKAVRWWELEVGEKEARAYRRASFRGHTQPVAALAGRGPYLFSGGWDGTAKFWDIRGSDRLTLRGHDGPIRALATNAALSLLVSGGHDGTIRLWRTLPYDVPERRREAPAEAN